MQIKELFKEYKKIEKMNITIFIPTKVLSQIRTMPAAIFEIPDPIRWCFYFQLTS